VVWVALVVLAGVAQVRLLLAQVAPALQPLAQQILVAVVVGHPHMGLVLQAVLQAAQA
jgi:hypothetical protein